jgi:hypothetical protein
MNKIIIILISIFIMIVIYNQYYTNQHIQVSKNMASTYYTGDSIVIRFNATDTAQLAIVQQIEALCKQYDIINCMNARDIFLRNN